MSLELKITCSFCVEPTEIILYPYVDAVQCRKCFGIIKNRLITEAYNSGYHSGSRQAVSDFDHQLFCVLERLVHGMRKHVP